MTDDLGLFGPDSVTWRVHREPILAIGGLRSLYLQALHPRAVAGVAQNSDYKVDPWKRLRHTAEYVATVVYGTTAEAEKAGKRVRSMHAKMRGTEPKTGRRFRVDEDELLRWVHVTEMDSFLSTALRAGLRLSPAEADMFHTEQRLAAKLVGLDPATVPGTVAEVNDYYEEMRPKLAMTVDAADSALFLSAPPLPWGLGFTPVRGMWFGVAALAVGLLPGWARKLYGLPGLPVGDMTAGLSARALRFALSALPHQVFEGPVYKSAMRRVAAQQALAGGG